MVPLLDFWPSRKPFKFLLKSGRFHLIFSCSPMELLRVIICWPSDTESLGYPLSLPPLLSHFGGRAMLTSYLVRCPHSGCDWFGSVIPRPDSEPWQSPASARNVVVFQCPQCEREWHARTVGDDVVPLPLEPAHLEHQA